MNDLSDAAIGREVAQIDGLPQQLATGATVLVASTGDPSADAVSLAILSERGDSSDSALVVTTTDSVDRTIETYEHLGSNDQKPALGVVDTASKQQSVSALYDETPVVYTSGPEDVERLIVALSELSGERPPADGDRHLIVRSLTPLLESTSTSLVCAALERITGLRSEEGLCLLGFDYTAHADETMAAVTEHVDGVLWVTGPTEDGLEFDYRPTRTRYSPQGEHDTDA